VCARSTVAGLRARSHSTASRSVTRSTREAAWETHTARPASCDCCRKAAFSRSDEDRGQEERTGVGRVGMPRDGDRVEAQGAEQWADEQHHEQAPRERPRGTGDEKDQHHDRLAEIDSDSRDEEVPTDPLVGVVAGGIVHRADGAVSEAK